MALDLRVEKRGLAELGVNWTLRGGRLMVHGDRPSDSEVQAAYDAWVSRSPDPSEPPGPPGLVRRVEAVESDLAAQKSRVDAVHDTLASEDARKVADAVRGT